MSETLVQQLRSITACDPGCNGRCKKCPDEITAEAADRIKQLEQEFAEARKDASERREAYHRDFLSLRDVQTPCTGCGGFGVRTYGSTATWRGGIGGQMITADVCDSCWGSGDANKKWPSHRNAAIAARTQERT